MSWTAFVDDKTVTDLPLARTGIDTRSMTRAMSPSSKPLLTKTTFVREEETAFRASSRGKMGVDGAIPYFDGTTNKFRANDLGRRVSRYVQYPIGRSTNKKAIKMTGSTKARSGVVTYGRTSASRKFFLTNDQTCLVNAIVVAGLFFFPFHSSLQPRLCQENKRY